MNRLLFVIIAIGVVIGLLFPDGGPRATGDVASGQSLGGTFSETSAEHRPRRMLRPEPRRKALTAAYTNGAAVVLKRGENGHYSVTAQVNGMPVEFIVDTGASGVALTTADAQRVGLQFSRADFDVVGSGASGPVNGKLVTLDRVSLQGKTVEQVPGAIIDGGEISLLGQSFLGRMGKIEISGDTMVIR